MPRNFLFLCVFSSFYFVAFNSQAEPWRQFRGDNQGRASVESAPLKWTDDSENIAWKTPIKGLGWSSPVVADGRIWLTTATEDGLSFRLISLDLATGKQLTDLELFRREKPLRIHSKNSHASPTVVLVDDHVYAHFGTYGTACVKTDGKIVWKTSIEYKHVHGPGGSPVVHDDLLLINCDGGDKQFVIALNRMTGEEAWRTDRPANKGKKFAFSTPRIIPDERGALLVSPGAGGVSAYEPTTGKQVWRVDYPGGYSVVPQPVLGDGLLYVSSSFDRPVLYAIRTAAATGNISDSHVAWTMPRGAPHTATPLLVGDELYVVSDGGVATCLDAKSGEVHWTQRLGGKFSASPLFAAGRIYMLNEEGVMKVLAPEKTYRELAENKLPGRTLATPAFVDNSMLIRNETHLYRIEAE